VIRTGVVFLLILKLKLLYRYFIETSEVLSTDRLNCLIMYVAWSFRWSV